MYAFDAKLKLVDKVDGTDDHTPLIFTCAHSHLYLYADVKDVRSLTAIARAQSGEKSKSTRYKPQEEHVRDEAECNLVLITESDVNSGEWWENIDVITVVEEQWWESSVGNLSRQFV